MPKTRTRLVALAAAAALTVAACGSSDPDTAAGTDTGAEASSADGGAGGVTFTAATLDGGTLESSALEGTDTVLWFWAPWCTICRAEAPDVVATAERFGDDVQVIGVAGRGEVGEMEGFVSDTDTGSLTHLVDDSGSIWSDYGVIAQPAFAFVNDDGTVELFTGSLGADGLESRIQSLIDT